MRPTARTVEHELGDTADVVDSEDEEDEDDAPLAPFEAPPGFAIAEAPPPEEQLAFSKEAEAPADALVGRSVLFKWPAIGWCIAEITERNVDARVRPSP